MTIRVEIKTPVVEKRVINGAKGEFEMFQLTGWATLDPDGYPEKVVFQVENGERFEVGVYELLPTSFYVGQYNRMELGKAKFKRIPTPPPLAK